jgi:hypothetical protein
LLLLTGIALLVAGCGLQDYEKKLEEHQKREAYLEAENAHLESQPLRLLEKKGKERAKEKGKSLEQDALNADSFFFRPPLGVSPIPEEKPVGILNKYAGRSENSGIKEMYVALAKNEDQDKFRKAILVDALKLNEKALKPPKPSEFSRLDSRPLVFDTYFEDSTKERLRVYLLRDPTWQLAIAYRLSGTAGSSNGVETNIDYAMRSTAFGTAAVQQHAVYRSAGPAVPRPKSTKK